VKVCLIFNPTRVPDCSIHKGVINYAEKNREIELLIAPFRNENVFDTAMFSDVEGYIAPAKFCLSHVPKNEWHRFSTWFTNDNLNSPPGVNVDNVEVGRLAANHLVGKGIRNYVYVHDLSNHNSIVRYRGFAGQLPIGTNVFEYKEGPETISKGWSLDNQIIDLASLLLSLPQPIGVFAYDGIHAARVLAACQFAGLKVPENVAVIATSTNSSFCQNLNPSVTAVHNSIVRMGYDAVELLYERISEKSCDDFRFCAPSPVIERSSTRIKVTDDPLLKRAFHWMDSTPMTDWNVDQLSAYLNCSRMTLQRHFRNSIQLTPKAYMLEMQLKAAQEKIMDTESTLLEIAHECGFSDSAHFSRTYLKYFGHNPSEMLIKNELI